MKAWSEQAEARLREWLAGRVLREGLDGAEAEELAADLRRHVHEEMENSSHETVSLMALEAVLEWMGGGEVAPDGPPPPPPAPPSTRAVLKRIGMWTFGVVLPAGVILFEWLASFCGAVFFDPLPSVWHVLLAISVPAVNAGLLVMSGRRRLAPWWAVAAGFIWLVSLGYGMLFLPLLPLSAIALIAYGMGLLSLTPIFAWLATWRIGRQVSGEGQPRVWRRNWWIGALAALAVGGVLEGPGLWTRSQLGMAAGEGKSAEAAVRRLRGFHSEQALLRACYEGNRGTAMSTDIAGWVMRGWRIPLAMFGQGGIDQLDSGRMREVFFRVTGKPFNTLKPPRTVREGSFLRSNSGRAFDDLEWDDHLGGDAVAVRLRDLDLAESRFDGHLEDVSGLGYGEWTMVFRNGAAVEREARCQVCLPRGGRVSRLTLWVNGEPREAAFAGVAKVREAYQEVAVRQRRDPVLVTMAGPDTVMVQCFPVPAHGEMKIRIGVTAPFDGGRWVLPRIVERNFGLADGLEHAVWLQSGRGFSLAGDGRQSARDGEGQSLAVSLTAVPEDPSWGVVEVADRGQPAAVWCVDPFADGEGKVLVGQPVGKRREAFERCVVVVDGSAALDGWGGRLAAALEGSAGEGEMIVLLADDGSRRVEPGELRRIGFGGGQDNEPALREAVRLAKEVERGAVVWVHGPQPVKLGQSEAILQLLERGSRRPVIHTVALAAGPNRLAEALGRSGGLVSSPHLVDAERELAGFLSGLRSESEFTGWNWSRQAGPGGPPEAKQVWDQLARWWAIEEVGRIEDQAAAAKLAARYQLVTPVSGAVVLETAEQYAAHGLEPVDGSATPQIPGVPEPSVAWLLIVAAMAAAVRRRRGAVNIEHRTANIEH